MTVSLHNPFSTGVEACATKLDSCWPGTLIENVADTFVAITHSNDITDRLVHNELKESHGLERYLTSIDKCKLKIISITSLISECPLQITKASLQYIVRKWNISPVFVSIVSAFGEGPRVSEEGFGLFNSDWSKDGSYGKTNWVLKLLTLGRNRTNDGVYHSHLVSLSLRRAEGHSRVEDPPDRNLSFVQQV